MKEFIRGRVSEIDRQTRVIQRHRDPGDFHKETESTFKLKNDNRTFLAVGKELIETGDELAFEYKNNNDGFFKVFVCKNLTKSWVADFGIMQDLMLIKIVVFPLLLITSMASMVYVYYNHRELSGLGLFSPFLLLLLSLFGFTALVYLISKRRKIKFIRKYNL